MGVRSESTSFSVLYPLSCSCLTNPQTWDHPMLSYPVRELRKHGSLAYVPSSGRVRCRGVHRCSQSSNDPQSNSLRQIWCEEDKDSVLIAADRYIRQEGIQIVEEKGALVAFVQYRSSLEH
jgi:hypothetical protein